MLDATTENAIITSGPKQRVNADPSLTSSPITEAKMAKAKLAKNPHTDNSLLAYRKYLSNKLTTFEASGFRVSENQLNDKLFDFQKHCVALALRKGRFGLFEECGLGKTAQQLEWAHQVVKHTNKPVLILTPLAVSAQTIAEGEKFGIEVNRLSPSDVKPGIHITNYEQLEHVDPSMFAGVVLDESGILKNFEGRTRQAIIDAFRATPYKLPCSATPSPNDPMELGNHAEFLNALSRNEMLAMYFVHDGGETAKWRLKGHAENDFWAFVASWSVMIARPSDLGFSDEGFILPELRFIHHSIETAKRDNGELFNSTAVSATDFNHELRLTKEQRLSKAVSLITPYEQTIIWVKQNEEADYLKAMIPGAVEVRGNERTEVKEQKLLAFARSEYPVLITKGRIAGWGLNFQNCHTQINAAPDFSFELLYQQTRRSYRFGQKHPVNIHLITTDTMQNVIEALETKEAQHKEMREKMIAATQELKAPSPYIGKHSELKNDHAWIKRGDAIELIREVPDESVGFSIFSPPFASLYTYSDNIADMGNCADYNAFEYAFSLLVEQLHRVMWSGRNVAVHCMDLPIQKGKEGFIGLRDFSGLIRECFDRAGFIYHSRVTIWKDPVTEMQRTKALGLLHKQVKKDAAMSRVGIPDYLLVFRKPGEHDHPVRCDIPVDTWQQYASPVWMDIDYGKTLNVMEARQAQDERHICPLQLQTIERAITLWTNEGDAVLTPFMGIGSEIFQAIKMNRKGIGFELKDAYFDVAVRNIQAAIEGKKQIELFEALAI